MPIYDVFRNCVLLSRKHSRRHNSSTFEEAVESRIMVNEFMLDPEYDETTNYEFKLTRERAIQTGEFQLVLSPQGISWLHEMENSRLGERRQKEAGLVADKVRQMDDWLEAESTRSLYLGALSHTMRAQIVLDMTFLLEEEFFDSLQKAHALVEGKMSCNLDFLA